MKADSKAKSNHKFGLITSIGYSIAVFGLLLIIIPALIVLFQNDLTSIEDLYDQPILFIIFFLLGVFLALSGLLALIITGFQSSSIKKKKKVKAIAVLQHEKEIKGEEKEKEIIEEVIEEALEEAIETIVEDTIEEEIVEDIVEEIADEVIELDDEEAFEKDYEKEENFNTEENEKHENEERVEDKPSEDSISEKNEEE